MNKSIFLAFSALVLSLSAVAETKKFMLLKDRREIVALPRMSVEDKAKILKNARFVYRDLYAHQDWKINRYGKKADLTPLLDKLEARIPSISDDSFHSELAGIFFNLKDFHTSYQFPKPYSCYRSLLPFSIEEVVDSSGKSKYYISELVVNEAALAVLPGPLKISVGDEIIRYENLSTEEAVQRRMNNEGANPDALKRSAVFALAFKSQNNSFFPENNEVQLVLKRPSGEEYETAIPWISKERADCVKKEEAETADKAIQRDLDDYRDLFRKTKKSKFRNMSKTSGFQETDEPILKWQIISSLHGNFGVVKLDNFEPEKQSVNELVKTIRDLLLEELKDTDGLIFDLRDNPGGYIRLGEYLVQLFSPKNITALNFTVQANASTKHFFENVSNGALFLNGINAAISRNEKYSEPLPLNQDNIINGLGQVYYKPVALFTNSLCYSTCDMISASVQDHGVGIIVGEDMTTGAGGANSNNLATLFGSISNKGPFELMPYDSNMSFSWRQTVRILKNQGKILEDNGVQSDYVIRPTLKDITSGSSEQYTKIAKLLKERKTFNSSVRMSTSAVDIEQGDRPGFTLQWENTDTIQLKENDQVLDSVAVELSNSSGHFVDFSSAIDTNELSSRKLQLVGLYKGQRVWNKAVTVRVIPPMLEVDSSLKITLQKEIVISGEKGWNISGTELQINDGKGYVTNTATDASLFVKVNKPLKLKMRAKIKTEENFDFFKLNIVSNGKTTAVERLTGNLGLKDYSIDLSPYLGKSIEIQFTFESDTMVNDEGVTLDLISLETI